MGRIKHLSRTPFAVEAAITAVFLGAFGLFALLDLNWVSYDMYNHMLFAGHYADHWFSTWIPGVGGGLDISTYPPLVFQTMAALSFLGLSADLSYRLLSAVAPALLGYSVYLYAREVMGLENERYRYLIPVGVAFSPAVLKAVFAFGQLTTLIGLGFGFYALYLYHRQITGSGNNPVLLVGALTLTAFTHHFSAVLLLIAMTVTTIYHLDSLGRDRILLLGGIGASSLALVVIGLFPAFTDFIGSALSYSTIPHVSRNPFSSTYSFELFLLTGYGATALGFLYPWMREKGKEVFTLAIVFAVLGLGHVTPIPELLFGGAADVITYDRFTFVAVILLAVVGVDLLVSRIESRHVTGVVVALYILSGFAGAFYAHDLLFDNPLSASHSQEERQETLQFLQSVPDSHRYQTFGYGPPIGDLYFYTDTPTLDTVYFTGRTLPWLRNSGEAELDNAGREAFWSIIRKADSVSLRYVLTYGEPYHTWMNGTGWDRMESPGPFQAWENTSPGNSVKVEHQRSYLMGLIPPTAFILFAFLILRRRYR